MTKLKKPDKVTQADWDEVGSPEWTEDDFARAESAEHVLPKVAYRALVERLREQSRAPKAPVKVPVKLRVDPDVIQAYKAAGPGWQTRMNEALRAGLTAKTHKKPRADAGNRQRP